MLHKDNYGNYELAYNSESIYLQGEDARQFETEVLLPLSKIWLRFYGTGLRKKQFGPYKNYEHQLNERISDYFA